MSRVTNIILHLGIEDACKIDVINAFFERKGIKGFVSIHEHQLPKMWYGGTKGFEAEIFIGAFNYFSISQLIGYIQEINNWKQKESVQLIVKDHEEYKFRIIDLFPKDQQKYEEEISGGV